MGMTSWCTHETTSLPVHPCFMLPGIWPVSDGQRGYPTGRDGMGPGNPGCSGWL